MQQYVLFKSHNQYFAIDVMAVDRIIETNVWISLPEVPDFILGAYEYQNQLVPITDLCQKLFGEFSTQKIENKVILCHWCNRNQGFYVEEIIGVVYLEETHYEQNFDKILLKSGYIDRFLKDSEQDLVMLLKLESLFDNQQVQEVFSKLEGFEGLGDDDYK